MLIVFVLVCVFCIVLIALLKGENRDKRFWQDLAEKRSSDRDDTYCELLDTQEELRQLKSKLRQLGK